MWTPAPDLVLCLLIASEGPGTSNSVSYLELKGPITLQAFWLSLYKISEPAYLTKPLQAHPLSLFLFTFSNSLSWLSHMLFCQFLYQGKSPQSSMEFLPQGYSGCMSWSISISAMVFQDKNISMQLIQFWYWVTCFDLVVGGWRGECLWLFYLKKRKCISQLCCLAVIARVKK